MEKIYLDYAATTPVDEKVEKAMRPYFSASFGNAGSLHSFGRDAVTAIDSARDAVAQKIGADFRDVIFTGSATEANNLALRGIIKALGFRQLGAGRLEPSGLAPKILVSSIEHESVLETARDLSAGGVEVVVLPVDGKGFVDLEKLESSLDERTVLVSVMYANNEIGTIQPVAEISKIIKKFDYKILFHTDAVQAFQYLDCNVNMLGVDFLTLSAHKIYGPKGVGALFARNTDSTPLNPVITGGGQEFGLRSGTENVPSIVGFAKTVEITAEAREKEKKRVGELRGHFWRELKKIYPAAEINGIIDGNSTLPNILNICFPGYRAEELLIKFDEAGIAVSAGSACQSRSAKSSHVLQALGFSEERARSSIRFSFGRLTEEREIKEALKLAAGILKK